MKQNSKSSWRKHTILSIVFAILGTFFVKIMFPKLIKYCEVNNIDIGKRFFEKFDITILTGILAYFWINRPDQFENIPSYMLINEAIY